MRQRGIFYTFSIGFVTCDSVVFFLLFLLVLQLLQQRGIFIYWFWNCCDSVVFFVFLSIGFGTVATAWYFLYFFLLVLGLLRKRGILIYWYFLLFIIFIRLSTTPRLIFFYGFGTVLMVWYFGGFFWWVFELFEQCGIFYYFLYFICC